MKNRKDIIEYQNKLYNEMWAYKNRMKHSDISVQEYNDRKKSVESIVNKIDIIEWVLSEKD